MDYLERILAGAHDHNAGNDFAGAVQVSNPAAQIGAHHDFANVPDVNGGTVFAGGENDAAEVFDGTGVAAAPHHIFSAAELQQASRGFVIATAHCRDDATERDAVRLQPVGVHVHLKLPGEAADGRNFSHARDRLQVVAQIPSLIRTQIGKILLAGRIDHRILKNPAKASGVRSQFRFPTFRHSQLNDG